MSRIPVSVAVAMLAIAGTVVCAQPEAQSGRGYVVWQKSLWGPLNPDEVPPADSTLDALEVIACRGEREATGFCLTNTSTKPLAGRLWILPPEEGTDAKALRPDCLCLATAEWIELADPGGHFTGQLVPDALVPLNKARLLTLGAGETKLIWLTFDARELEPGQYQGRLRFRPHFNGFQEVTIPFSLQVSPVAIGPELSQHWVYLSNSALNLSEAVSRDLAEHGVNCMYTHLCVGEKGPGDLWPLWKEDGSIASWDPSYLEAQLQTFLKYNPLRANTRFVMYLGWECPWYLNLKNPRGQELQPFSQPWQRAVREFLRALRELLGKYEIAPEQVCLVPVDEPTTRGKVNRVELLTKAARLIKTVEPRFQIFTNLPSPQDLSLDELKQFAPYVDVWCPYVARFNSAEEMEFFRQSGKPVWAYSIVAKYTPPVQYRRPQWRSFELGLDGLTTFWCYNQSHGDPWDSYDDNQGVDYNVVYANGGAARWQEVIPSRRWESFAEGIDDFRLLRVCKRLLAQAQEQGLSVDSHAHALNHIVDETLASTDPDAFGKGHVRLIRLAESLLSQLNR